MCAARPRHHAPAAPPLPPIETPRRARARPAAHPLPSHPLQDGLFYDVRQQILLAPADDSSSTGEGGDAKVLAECYVRMVFLKDGALSKPPQRIVDSIEARRSAVDTADWS